MVVPGKEAPSRKAAEHDGGQRPGQQLRQGGAGGDGAGGPAVHTVLPVPPPQDVRGDQDAGRGRARGEMGGVAERGHAKVRLVGAPAPEIHRFRGGGRVLGRPRGDGALRTKVTGGGDQFDRADACCCLDDRIRLASVRPGKGEVHFSHVG